GGLYVVFVKNQSYKVLGHLLSFSSGVMIYISFMDLLPEAIAEIGFFNSNLWFFFGMIFFAVILKVIPHDHEEEESDHGHGHNSTKPINATINKKDKKDHYLNMVGIRTAIGVSLHNFPEGVAVYLSCLKGVDVGLPLMLAIAAHNIPEGMAVAAPIYSATNSKWKAFKYCLYSGLCEPIGAVVFGIIFNSFMTPYLIQSMLAAVAGIMVFMVLKELLPASLKYISVNESVFSNIVGMMFFFFSIHYLHQMLPHDHGSGDHGHSHGSHGHSHGHSHNSPQAQGINFEKPQKSSHFNAFE
ncbi:hypothetical protein DICPUDRAFT_39053, partial [Dictyostelium purpureum]